VAPSDRYTLALYGDNVTDEAYRTMAQAIATGIGAGSADNRGRFDSKIY
jgi:hypothetical protein